MVVVGGFVLCLVGSSPLVLSVIPMSVHGNPVRVAGNCAVVGGCPIVVAGA